MEGLKKYFYKDGQKILSQPKMQIDYFVSPKANVSKNNQICSLLG